MPQNDNNKCPQKKAKTSSQRMEKTRQFRKELGLVRKDIYAHPEDWPEIREFESQLAAKRGIKI